MKNFNNSWRNFLNEDFRTENVPLEDTRIKIKLENKQKLLREVTEDEFEHIQRAIDDLDYEDLAFYDLFGDKSRLVVEFPTPDNSTPLGRFISMWQAMGYTVDWQKGIVSGVRSFRDTSPGGMAAELVGGGVPSRSSVKNVKMKIGKWFSKLLSYNIKYKKYKERITAHMDSKGEDWGPGNRARVTGNDIKDALGEDEATNYYRLGDNIDMLLRTKLNVEPEYLKKLRTVEHVSSLMDYWRDNAAAIKNNLDKAHGHQYSIIITRDPVDVWRMADFKNLSSCHSPPSRGGSGEYYKCAVAEAHGHGAVAYVVDTEDLLHATNTANIDSAEQEIQDGEIFGDTARMGGAGFDLTPVARLRLRQLRFYENNKKPEDYEGRNPYDGTQIAVPEIRTYGAAIPGFRERVVQWAREKQITQMDQAPRTSEDLLILSDFISFGGSYTDNPMVHLMTQLFGNTIKGTEGYVKQDTETEDTLDVDLVGGLLAQYQQAIHEYSEAYNRRMGWTRVQGTAVDDGADNVYITMEAVLTIQWHRADFKRMPGVDVISHGLEELHDYGLGWVQADYPSIIRKTEDRQGRPGVVWELPIDVVTERLVGFNAQEYAYDPDNYEEWCATVDDEVDEKHNVVEALLTNFFKREGYMDGGAVMRLGRDVMNDDTGLYHWEALAEEGYEPDEYEFIQFTAHPEVWYNEFNVSEEEAMRIMQDRNFWLEIRKRMAAPAFESTGHEMYPQMPLDMDMFGEHGTEGESQELNLYFSIHGEDPDEMVEVLVALVNIWDDQGEIDRVASEVFGDMLQGSVALDGTSVVDLTEERKIMQIETMLSSLSEQGNFEPATDESAEADLAAWFKEHNLPAEKFETKEGIISIDTHKKEIDDYVSQVETGPNKGDIQEDMWKKLCDEGIKKPVIVEQTGVKELVVDGTNRFIAAQKCRGKDGGGLALPIWYVTKKGE